MYSIIAMAGLAEAAFLYGLLIVAALIALAGGVTRVRVVEAFDCSCDDWLHPLRPWRVVLAAVVRVCASVVERPRRSLLACSVASRFSDLGPCFYRRSRLPHIGDSRPKITGTNPNDRRTRQDRKSVV